MDQPRPKTSTIVLLSILLFCILAGAVVCFSLSYERANDYIDEFKTPDGVYTVTKERLSTGLGLFRIFSVYPRGDTAFYAIDNRTGEKVELFCTETVETSYRYYKNYDVIWQENGFQLQSHKKHDSSPPKVVETIVYSFQWDEIFGKEAA